MVRAGILDNAILVVDRSLHPGNNDIVLASVNNDFTCKKLRIVDGCMRLSPESDDKRFKEIIPSEGTEVVIWGVVTSAVNEFRR